MLQDPAASFAFWIARQPIRSFEIHDSMDVFDPYLVWLGIPPDEQPPDHYRLLGIPRFVEDVDVITNAADRQMSHLRTFATSQYPQYSQGLLNDVASAKVCLLDPVKKATYDTFLRENFSVAPPTLPTASADFQSPVATQPSSSFDSETASAGAVSESTNMPGVRQSATTSRTRRPRKNTVVIKLVGIVIAGVLGVVIALTILTRAHNSEQEPVTVGQKKPPRERSQENSATHTPRRSRSSRTVPIDEREPSNKRTENKPADEKRDPSARAPSNAEKNDERPVETTKNPAPQEDEVVQGRIGGKPAKSAVAGLDPAKQPREFLESRELSLSEDNYWLLPYEATIEQSLAPVQRLYASYQEVGEDEKELKKAYNRQVKPLQAMLKERKRLLRKLAAKVANRQELSGRERSLRSQAKREIPQVQRGLAEWKQKYKLEMKKLKDREAEAAGLLGNAARDAYLKLAAVEAQYATLGKSADVSTALSKVRGILGPSKGLAAARKLLKTRLRQAKMPVPEVKKVSSAYSAAKKR